MATKPEKGQLPYTQVQTQTQPGSNAHRDTYKHTQRQRYVQRESEGLGATMLDGIICILQPSVPKTLTCSLAFLVLRVSILKAIHVAWSPEQFNLRIWCFWLHRGHSTSCESVTFSQILWPSFRFLSLIIFKKAAMMPALPTSSVGQADMMKLWNRLRSKELLYRHHHAIYPEIIVW